MRAPDRRSIAASPGGNHAHGLGAVAGALPQDLAGLRNALAAAASHAQFASQVLQGRAAERGGAADLALGDAIAVADVQGGPFVSRLQIRMIRITIVPELEPDGNPLDRNDRDDAP